MIVHIVIDNKGETVFHFLTVIIISFVNITAEEYDYVSN